MAVKGAKGRTGKMVVWVIVGLLVVGLAGFGATNFGGSVRSIGSVGDTEIPLTTYARALQQELRAISQQTGQTLTFAEAQSFGLDRSVLRRVVAEAALDDEADRLGLSVGDAQVLREIQAIPAFQGVDGGFDREAYEFTLDRSGFDVAEFEEQVRDETARSLLQAAVASGVATPEGYVDTLFDYAREGRDFAWTQLTRDDLESEVRDPTLDEVQAFYDENPNLFELPGARVVTYAWITPDMLLDTIEVDEGALREAYDRRRAEYVRPERRLVERLVFADESAAQAAAEAIAAGETDFDTLVEERDLTLEDVDLGEVTRDELGTAGEAVFALDEPGVAGPAESPLGPALYRVNAILAPQETPFEAARDELRSELAADRARRAIDAMIDDVDDRLAAGATLEDVAAETDLQVETIELRPDSEAPIAGYEAFREAAAEAGEGDFPEVRRLEDGGIFALRLDRVEPPRVPPLDEVRAEVVQAWQAAQAADRLRERAQAAALQLEAGAPPDEAGLELTEVEGALRDGFVEGLPGAALTAVFEMEPGEVRVVDAAAGPVVVLLRGIVPADQTTQEPEQVKAAFASQTAQTISTDLLDAFTRAVEADAGISLDQSAINAVHTQLP